VRRNHPVGVVPYIIREDDLPRGQKILVFLPHTDDGRYIGATLSLMNSLEGGVPRNQIRIVVVCPGYHSVEGDLSNAEKTAIRRDEALAWGGRLGFSPGQFVFFDAERTYATRRCDPGEQRRMDELLAAERPSMVCVTHPSDVAQHTNACARAMVMSSVARLVERTGDGGIFVVEYPTLHVPILPPADKTLIVAFSDPTFPAIKHEANTFHKSQESKFFDMMGRFVEAIDAVSCADTVLEARRAGEAAACDLSDVTLNPVKSRGEHFGVTRLRVRRTATGPVIVQERVRFPLQAENRRLWATAG
jgi:LmbE family N-acetylglucosaminyl deacetylase